MRALATLTRPRNLLIGAGFVAILTALGIGQAALDQSVAAAQGAGKQAPRFEVDPFWPKPLPNHWVLGSTIGVWVGRGRPRLDHPSQLRHARQQREAARERAGRMLPRRAAGARVRPGRQPARSWGGPGEGYEWPDSNHGIFVDHKGNVWIGGNGAPRLAHPEVHAGRQVPRCSSARRARAETGAAAGSAKARSASFAGGSNDPENFGRVAKMFVDAKANEAYVADGYLNKRVAVLDADTGKIKRYWGAYGNGPDDTPLPALRPDAPPAQQFRSRCTAPTCRSTAWCTSATA